MVLPHNRLGQPLWGCHPSRKSWIRHCFQSLRESKGGINLFITSDGFFTTRKRSLWQGNIFRSVCQEVKNSVHRGGNTWAVTSPPGPGTPPVQCMLRDTGNKRAVRILLECILVLFTIYSVNLVHRKKSR